MNRKVVKLRAERRKNDEKIADLQSRNKEIDRLIVELENTDIIGLVRENALTPDMLAELIHSMKKDPAPVVSGNYNRMEDSHDPEE